MHRIDTPTAQIDKFGQGKNGFTNGDPATGRRATDLNSDMWDAVQEEICNAIEKSGAVLDKGLHDQLYQAIVKLITDRVPDALLRKNNLSDVVDKALARGNLELKGAAVLDVGQRAGTVAAGDDSRITGAMQKSQNGADIVNKSEFRKNIGLVIGSEPGNVVTSGSSQPVYRTTLNPIGYNEIPPQGIFANAAGVVDSVTKISTTLLTKTGSGGWVLGMSLGTYLGAGGTPDDLAHVLICTDGAGFSRRWYFYNNGKCVGPAGEFASQDWVSTNYATTTWVSSNFATTAWINDNFISSGRRGGQAYQAGSGSGQGMAYEAPAGCFLTGINTLVADGRGMGVYYRALQVYIPSKGYVQIGD
ncbi:TPA: hypothetical protein ACHICZ_004346 [Enterobacter asburiae]